MNNLNRTTVKVGAKLPIKIVQFGEGNFLRAFVDYVVDRLNTEANFNGGVVVVQPLNGGLIPTINAQGGLYTLFMRGIKKGELIDEKIVISSVQKGINPYSDYQEFLALAEEESLEFLISNTTESGIAYNADDKGYESCPSSFPGKVTALLHKRYVHFNGAKDKGLTVIPCELINHNADTLKEIVLQYARDWNLGQEFIAWIENHNHFHNTLVDRIVPGYPKDDLASYEDRLEYKDKLIVAAEIFLLWVIEGDDRLLEKIPFHKIDENVLVVKDMQPYRTRKVRILNGAHTAVVPLSIMYGNTTVKETMDDAVTSAFLKQAVFEEINPILPLPKAEVDDFAEEVFDRFRNPFIKHLLSSIALNSISKFKVRVLPSLLDYQDKFGKLPLHLTFSFACLIRFYKGDWKGTTLPVQDDAQVVDFFKTLWSTNDYAIISEKTLSNLDFWDEDLTQVPELSQNVAKALEMMDTFGIAEGLNKFSEESKVVG
ncbi:tagaturonate reductase [Flagellimonas sp.]|uniref:tagaturonate reductase n=1 Tax=Flagellimonas sp. TaxID=2058762 RepID=UPI003AB12690